MQFIWTYHMTEYSMPSWNRGISINTSDLYSPVFKTLAYNKNKYMYNKHNNLFLTWKINTLRHFSLEN